MAENWLALNRANWDERVPVHLAAPEYDLAALRHPGGFVLTRDDLSALVPVLPAARSSSGTRTTWTRCAS